MPLLSSDLTHKTCRRRSNNSLTCEVSRNLILIWLWEGYNCFKAPIPSYDELIHCSWIFWKCNIWISNLFLLNKILYNEYGVRIEVTRKLHILYMFWFVLRRKAIPWHWLLVSTENQSKDNFFIIIHMLMYMPIVRYRTLCGVKNSPPNIVCLHSGGRLNKKDGLTRYGDSHVKDKTS